MSTKSIENTEQVRELERAILGGLMLETERYDAVSEIIEFTDFESQDHQNIFSKPYKNFGDPDPYNLLDAGFFFL